MSVIGIDFGNESCYIAVARAGGIETIANDYSLRATPSCVAFSDRSRIVGVAAANQRVTNMKNTIVGFKRLLGRKYNDPYVQAELQHLPFSVVPQSYGSIGIKVHYLNEEKIFSPEQITGMLFTKLKDIAETALKIKVHDCVISVPSFYTQAERRAVLDAARIAGLNVLRLLNETISTALAYGIYKQDLPAPEEKPRNVVFVDCGHSSLQVSVAAFDKTKLVMLASASDAQLGGRDFDRILVEHLAKEFQTNYKIDVMRNARAYLRLSTEVEKLKKQMSANSTKLPLNIECFMDDKDVQSYIQRCDMEQLCADLLQRVERTLIQCLHDSKLSVNDIHSVEIVGGGSRIPSIKQLIEQVFHKQPSTTLNQDEAVARGCAVQCATLSPNFRVRDFSIRDIQPFPIQLRWDNGQMEVFPANHPVPFSKLLTFYRREPFALEAFYNGATPYPDPYIGRFFIKDVKPTSEGKDSPVKVKVRVNLHGILIVASAALMEPLPPAEEKEIEQKQAAEADEATKKKAAGEDKMETDGPAQNGATSGPELPDSRDEHEEEVDMGKSQQQQQANAKRRMRSVPLTIDSETHGYSETQLRELEDAELQMIGSDSQEKNRVDAKNSLEEYVYDLRGRLHDEKQLQRYVPPEEFEELDQRLEGVVNWLYEEGEDCERSVYASKLDELKKICEPIKARRIEAELLPRVIEELARSIQQAKKLLEQATTPGDDKWAHLTADELKQAKEETDRIDRWLDERRSMYTHMLPHKDPPVTVAEIRSQKQTFESIVTPIFDKPKPKPKEESQSQQPPPPSTEGSNQQKNDQPPQPSQENNIDDKMDVD